MLNTYKVKVFEKSSYDFDVQMDVVKLGRAERGYPLTK